MFLGARPAGSTLPKDSSAPPSGDDPGTSPARPEDWRVAEGLKVEIGTYAETAAFADLVVLSVLGTAAEDVLRSAGPDRLTRKVVLDASDPSTPSGRSGLFVGPPTPSASAPKRLAQRASVVKGLNIVVAEVIVDPSLTGGEPDMFIAANSKDAKRTVTTTLLAEFGWPVVDLGGIENARRLDCSQSRLGRLLPPHRQDHHAFKLIGKSHEFSAEPGVPAR